MRCQRSAIALKPLHFQGFLIAPWQQLRITVRAIAVLNLIRSDCRVRISSFSREGKKNAKCRRYRHQRVIRISARSSVHRIAVRFGGIRPRAASAD